MKVLRTALVWTTATGAALGVAAVGTPEAVRLVRAPGPGFADLLVQCCTTIALVATAALWLTASEVAWSVLRSRPAPGQGWARRLLLAACGVGVLAAATPATATPSDPPLPPAALAGLPLPDRPVDGPARPPPTVHVRPGDTLWAIARRTLGPGASAADVTSYWRRIHARNADLIGPDPDLIHPGQTLRLPAPAVEER